MDNLIYIGGESLEVAYKETVNDNSSATTYTFNSVDFGEETDTRRIVITVQGRRDAGGVVNSATIGGIAATIHTNSSLDQGSISMISALVPSGLTGTVAITWSLLQAACGINVYRLIGESDPTPVFALTDTSNPLNVTPTISEETAVIACARNFGSTSFTWGGTLGIVEDNDTYPLAEINTSSVASVITSDTGNITATPASFSVGGMHAIGFK